MNVRESVAIVPRSFHAIRNNLLSARMVLVVTLVALVTLVAWWLLDLYYQHSVQEFGEAGYQLMLPIREQRTFLILTFVFLYCTFFVCMGRRIRKIHYALDRYSSRLGIQLPRASEGDGIGHLGKRLERMSEAVIAETSALEYQARHDALTNLPNLYEAKRKQSGFSLYAPDQDDHSISRLGLSGELRDAISENQLMLEYQPMVDFKTGRIFCAEALVRWRHPQYGVIPPEEFIPTAEQTGVIRPLTIWVIDKALAQAANWSRSGIDLHISVNVSVRSLQDRKLPGQVQKLLDRHKVDPEHVILEITESSIMSDPLTARRVMRRLSNMGFQLSIDDFGTGYSSLAYLKQLPVDEIKIDRSFVTQMDQDENDAVIVRATIDLAHNLGLKVVAEGVESNDVWDLLEMLGCDTAQGYYIHKPLQPQALAEWIYSKECSQARWVTSLGLAT